MTCHVVHILEATGGGTRRHLHDILAYADRRQFNFSVICSAGREAGFADEIDWMRGAGIRVAVVPMGRAVRPTTDWQAYARLVKLLAEWNPDVVHTHSTKAGAIGRLAAWRVGVRQIVHTPHCWPFAMQVGPLRQWLYANCERFLARRCHTIVGVCQAEVELGKKWRIADDRQLRLIYNGVDIQAAAATVPPDRLPPEWGRLRIGGGVAAIKVVAVIGRLTRQKGQCWFVEAMAPLLAERHDLRLVMIGDGEERRRLETLIARLDIGHRCQFVGQHEDPRWLYSLIDVVAIPSMWEALPYVLLDALAAGRPVVASRVGGLPEVVEDGVNGRLVDPGAAEAARTALAELLDDREQWTQMSRQAVVTARRFEIARMIDSLQNLYLEKPIPKGASK